MAPRRNPAPTDDDGPRRPWSRSERPVPLRVLRPLQTFLETEAASGFLLLGATAVALAWANSAWGETYERFRHQTLTVRFGNAVFAEDLRHWVNEALMTFFFLALLLHPWVISGPPG